MVVGAVVVLERDGTAQLLPSLRLRGEHMLQQEDEELHDHVHPLMIQPLRRGGGGARQPVLATVLLLLVEGLMLMTEPRCPAFLIVFRRPIN